MVRLATLHCVHYNVANKVEDASKESVNTVE